jgi:uncharacterized protein (AIM24 family)
MNYEIKGEIFPVLHINLAPNEKIKVSAGTLQGYIGDAKIESITENGTSWLKWTASIFGKSIFQTQITAQNTTNIRLGTKGTQIIAITLQENDIFLVRPTSFLTAFETDYTIVFKNYNTFLRFEGKKKDENAQISVIFLEIFGENEIFNLEENQNFRLDEGHLVAFEESVIFKDDFNLKQLKTSILSEADFILLAGKGKIFIQSRKYIGEKKSYF